MANPCLLHLPLRDGLDGRDRNGIVTATASGPVRFTADGYFAEEATTNGVPDPSFENTTITTYWGLSGVTLTRDTAFALLGGASAKIVTDNAASVEGMGLNGPSGPPASVGQTWTASLWVYGTGSLTLFVRERDTSGNLLASSVGVNFTASDTWTRITHTHTIGNAGTTKVSLSVVTQTQQAATFWIDGAQLEQKAYATSYCDGSLGAGYSWAGTAHASASSRAGSRLTAPKPAGVLSGSMAVAVRVAPTRLTVATKAVWFMGSYGGAGGDFHSMYIESVSGRPYALYKNATQSEDTSFSPIPLVVGSPSVVIGNWSATTLQIFHDGALGPATLRDQPINDNFIGTTMGIGAIGASAYANAYISDLMIFDRPLTESERTNLAAMDIWSFDTLRDDRQSRRSLSMGLSF